MIYKLVARVIQYFCFHKRPMKGGDILDFYKVGNLRKEKYEPPYQLYPDTIIFLWMLPFLWNNFFHERSEVAFMSTWKERRVKSGTKEPSFQIKEDNENIAFNFYLQVLVLVITEIQL